MKKRTVRIFSIFLAAFLMPALFACGGKPADTDTESVIITDNTDVCITDEITDAAETIQLIEVTETDEDTFTETEAETEAEATTDTEAEQITEPETEESVKVRKPADIIADIAANYGVYGDRASDRIDSLIEELRTFSEDDADKWVQIMDLWRSLDKNLVINYDVLPDGLIDTDELCIVALGFQLNPDGSMKTELKERLRVLLNSANKYPNAYIVCTGGGTADKVPSATEAKVMASWLIENGVSSDRIIIEDKSTSTAFNAIYTLDILSKGYPEITQIAIVSSDYHIHCGTLMFAEESILRADKAGEEKYTVVSNAACRMPQGKLSDMYTPSSVVEITGDIETSIIIYHNEYEIPKL